ncbi:MAG: hypothetical protein E6G56_14985 [Actinobacteria bacterium]|nr:MAG: hypothetical protein E6G56_14985 [Actinomycetota bacterium]
MALSRTQVIDVPLPRSESYARCLEVGQALGKAMVKDEDESAGTVTFKVPMSIRSWGERVTLRLEERGADCTTVEVTSRSSLPGTLADYGKNSGNVEKVAAWLARETGGTLRPPTGAGARGLRPTGATAPPQGLWAPYQPLPPRAEAQPPEAGTRPGDERPPRASGA